MGLHSITYCERLFYLEEVEGIHLADDRVLAGRILHADLPQDAEIVEHVLESERLGIRGKLDAIRRDGGRWTVVEHKRGSCRREPGLGAQAWDADRMQVVTYILLLADVLDLPLEDVDGRIIYHGDRASIHVVIDDADQIAFDRAMTRRNELIRSSTRPPPCVEMNRCLRCSLAPACLPEEARLSADPGHVPVTLLPRHDDGEVLHVVGHDHRVSRSGDRIVITDGTRRKVADVPVAGVRQVVVHGNAQVTTQTLTLLMSHGVQTHWLTAGGRYMGGTAGGTPGIQRRIRQFTGLGDPTLRLGLARRIVAAKVRDQLGHLLRASRTGDRRTPTVRAAADRITGVLRRIPTAVDIDGLLGYEGDAAAAYWSAFPDLLLSVVPATWRPVGRTRRPPKDATNALLSFLYGLLYRDVVAAILAVGLEPSFGCLHAPRTNGYPLAEDLMELFRVTMVDMVVIASLNRRQWTDDHVVDAGPAGWMLTDTGRKLAIGLYEERRSETWKHPVIGHTLSYGRHMELEARLIEKAWSGDGDLFAKRVLR